jgi:hypothetical protein
MYITVPFKQIWQKKFNKYHGMSLLINSYNILHKDFLSNLIPYIDEITQIICEDFDVTD